MSTGTVVLEVPVGDNRRFSAQGFDRSGNIVSSGETISTVKRGLNLVTIA
jgi:hypothetical protein